VGVKVRGVKKPEKSCGFSYINFLEKFSIIDSLIEENKLILAWNRIIYIPESYIYLYLTRVKLNYKSGLNLAKFQNSVNNKLLKPLLASKLLECLFIRYII
jgi:hypothetical protein